MPACTGGDAGAADAYAFFGRVVDRRIWLTAERKHPGILNAAALLLDRLSQDAQHERDILEHRLARNELEVLEDEPDGPPIGLDFVAIERRTAAPLVVLAWFRTRNFAWPVLSQGLANFAYMGGFIIIPLVLGRRGLGIEARARREPLRDRLQGGIGARLA